MMRKAKLWCKQ